MISGMISGAAFTAILYYYIEQSMEIGEVLRIGHVKNDGTSLLSCETILHVVCSSELRYKNNDQNNARRGTQSYHNLDAHTSS